jgi:hypothetical protein
MQDDTNFAPPRRRSAGRFVMTLVLLVLLAGGMGLGWLVWQGRLGSLLPGPGKTDEALTMAQPLPASSASPAPIASPGAAPSPDLRVLGSVETRLALLEERLSRLDLQAEAASGNAARAEGLLIAFATRRALDRGAPLGYLEDQLKLRFGNAQPNAVHTVIDAAANPVTLDELSAGLEAAAPSLAQTASEGDAWSKVKSEIAGLFIVRRDTTRGITDEQRIERAQLLLASGKTEQAVAIVQAMPGAAKADKWLADARRYGEARRALDLIETAAILEPRSLQDSAGRRVVQPSPVAAPAPAVPAPAATGSASPAE